MTLSEMKHVLAARGIRLTKSLGQNFLFDHHQVQRIVQAAEVTGMDAILEIGPGLGALTELLLDRAGSVLAVEKDQRLIQPLQARFAAHPRFTLVHADVVDFLHTNPRDWSRWKIVANLPYSATTPILTAILHAHAPPQRVTVTVQWEVAQRLTATPAHPDYGVLSLLTQLRYQTRSRFKIPRTCFFPEPEVESGVITLQRRAETLLDPAASALFERVVRLSFAQRRKMMLKILKTRWPERQLHALFAATGLSPAVRAEEVTLDQFVELARGLRQAADSGSQELST